VKVLILGVNGLIGSTIYRVLNETTDHFVYGTVRHESYKFNTFLGDTKNIYTDIDLLNDNTLTELLLKHRPDTVINCAGLTKHKQNASNVLDVLPINSIFSHKLVKLCGLSGTRVVHISTDCVFSGKKGNYSETDRSDASDLYGISKYLGEVDYSNAITLRTSTIGHEKKSTAGLLEWFLSQSHSCKGFNNAIFSGLPTVTLAKIIRDYILNETNLSGLYHVSSAPIDKRSLLEIIAKVYNKNIQIITDDSVVINRSLNGEKFLQATGYLAPPWSELVVEMYTDFKGLS